MTFDWEVIANGADLGGGIKVLWGPTVEDLASLYDRASRTGGMEVAFPAGPPGKVYFVSQAGTSPCIGVYMDDTNGGRRLVACLWASDILRLREVNIRSITASLIIERGSIPIFQLIRAIRASLFMVWVEYGPCVVIAEVADGNEPMRAVLRRVGMACSGSLPMRSVWDGKPCSAILYYWPATR